MAMIVGIVGSSVFRASALISSTLLKQYKLWNTHIKYISLLYSLTVIVRRSKQKKSILAWETREHIPAAKDQGIKISGQTDNLVTQQEVGWM